MVKHILVTGGSRGIGRAVAILAGEHGWSVGVNYAGNDKAAAETVAAVKAAGGNAIAIQGDVANEADEIGRAACRERVCQNVWIWVVAGSLKKKSHKINKKRKTIAAARSK